VLATSNTLLPPFNLPDMPVMRQPPSQATRRVLHLRTVTGRGGGPEKTILNSPRYIGPGYEMRLAYFRPRDDAGFDLASRAERLGVTVVDIPEKGALDFAAIRRLRAEIRDFRPHILHPHDYKTNFLAVSLGRWYDIPVVTTMHGYVTRSARLSAYYAIDRWSLRRMDHVVAVSDDLRQCATQLGVAPQKCSVVHNAIDSDVYAPRHGKEDAKRMLGLPTGGLTVGAVGRLSAEKGFDRLIRAADTLMQEGWVFDVAIVGEGPEWEGLKRQIDRCHQPRRFHLLGQQSDMIPFYGAIDVFALSSLREGLPNVLLEAMSMAVPVVATRVAGVPRLVEDETNGLLVEPDDERQLAHALRHLLENVSLRDRLGAAGRRTVVERFSFQRRMEKIRHIYESVLAERTSGRSVGRNGSHD
jgi:glycosyltransferase involved in cell wall biosynthesis